MANRVSLAELAVSDIRLRPSEAVTIVSAICAQHIAGTLPGIPSPGVIRLTRDGDLTIEGPITTAQDTVTRAALLLADLLPRADGLPEYRASGALRLVIARGLGSIDVPPYGSLEEFRVALSRFGTEDVREVARALFYAWERASVTRAFKAAPRADLTISDVRRARRATGLSLGYLATVAEVPPRRLRDLEWGYMREWPATAEARAQVIRYARAAGLDESIVLSIAWPMIVENEATCAGTPSTSTALVPAGPRQLAVIARAAAPATSLRWRAALIAAAAALALLGGFIAGSRSAAPASQLADAQHVDLPGPPPPAPAHNDENRVTATPGVRAQPIGTRGLADAPRPVRAAVPLGPVGSARAAAPAKEKRRRPAPSRPAPREEPRKPVLERELFRIVIR